MKLPAFTCVGFTLRDKGAAVNGGDCGNYDGTTCLVKDELKGLYKESPRFKAWDRMMQGNKGVRIKKAAGYDKRK